MAGGALFPSLVRLIPRTAPLVPVASTSELRRLLRARRRAIPPQHGRQAARLLLRSVLKYGWLRAGRRVGLYLSTPEEIDTGPLLAAARRLGCRLYLPRVTRYRDSRMALFSADAPLRRSRYGIYEPQSHDRPPLRQLDVIFVPLVGFDGRCNRMGMGKGFYDRLLAARRAAPQLRRPLLVGLAYECQQVTQLLPQSHDVPLDFVVTESQVHRQVTSP
ncbi:MAG: 5-formyltetrahydrofolate cyclo-ligase [Pseudomonadota bacterium]